ncbi:MAG: RCC1 repeat-containing protein [Polyangiaceae bacterium]|nr:RCC1 repeat-containing protein [Polyangiaceae bacterium]
MNEQPRWFSMRPTDNVLLWLFFSAISACGNVVVETSGAAGEAGAPVGGASSTSTFQSGGTGGMGADAGAGGTGGDVNLPCSTNPCQNGGACVVVGAGFECNCPCGFGGNLCESPPDNKAIAVSAGLSHSLALLSDGTVWVWGGGESGQLGNANLTSSLNPVQVSNLTNIIAVGAGASGYSVAVNSAGQVWTWGNNLEGQLGLGAVYPTEPTPVQVPNLSNVVAVSTGQSHVLALTASGQVWAWGNNSNGQVGSGNLSNVEPNPVKVPGLSNVQAISAGKAHSLAVDANGLVWAWGGSSKGQLGNGSFFGDKNLPIAVPGLTNAIAVAAGDLHSLVLKNDGTVWAFGLNDVGQLADGTVEDKSVPVQTPIVGAVSVAAGDDTSFAILEDGTVVGWGYNSVGQLGNGSLSGADSANPPAPVLQLPAVASVAAGRYHNLALTASGLVLGWGAPNGGTLGNGAGAERLVPTRISTFPPSTRVTAGGSTLVLGVDGQIRGVGLNGQGELGDGTFSPRTVPSTVKNLTNVSDLGQMRNTGVAVENGNAFCWGANGAGQVGNGTLTGANVPFQTLSNVGMIAGGSFHTAALTQDGMVWGWGSNADGQLGNGTSQNSTLPVQTNITEVTSIAAGANHTLAVKQDKTVWAWGSNLSGALGNGTTQNGNLPSQVVGLANVIQVAAGADHSLALTESGQVWAWGGNGNGQLGTSPGSPGLSPIPVSGLPQMTRIAAGPGLSFAISTTGDLWAWGYAAKGQLGNNSTSPVVGPTQVVGLTQVVDVAAGPDAAFAITSNGSVWAWGSGALFGDGGLVVSNLYCAE